MCSAAFNPHYNYVISPTLWMWKLWPQPPVLAQPLALAWPTLRAASPLPPPLIFNHQLLPFSLPVLSILDPLFLLLFCQYYKIPCLSDLSSHLCGNTLILNELNYFLLHACSWVSEYHWAVSHVSIGWYFKFMITSWACNTAWWSCYLLLVHLLLSSMQWLFTFPLF